MKKIIYFLFVVAQFSAYSQIEISKVTTIRGANFYSGLKDNVNNTYISLRIFPSLKDSFFIDNNFISLSTGKIDTINNRGERGVVIVKIDSSYQDIKYHQFYGKGPDVDVSELFLASDNCIYFTIRSYDTVNIEKIPYYYKSKHGFTLLMKSQLGTVSGK